MKNLRELHWLLNLKIKRDWNSKTITISQPTYIERVIDQFNFQDSKTHYMLLYPNVKLSNAHLPKTEQEK